MNEIKQRRNIIITGTSRGIGNQLAKFYCNNDYNVFGISRTESKIDNENYIHTTLDLSNHEEILEYFKNYKKKFKNLYALINNAGTLTSMNSLLLPKDSIDNMIDINIKENFFMSRESAKIMMLKKEGRIVNIGSMASTLKPNGDSIYAMTKSAIKTLATVLSKEYAPYGITSNTVDITYIETTLSKKIDSKAIEKIISSLPIPRTANFLDITNVINFYLSDNSSYITGQNISLGGL